MLRRVVIVFLVAVVAWAGETARRPAQELGILQSYGDSARIFDEAVSLVDLEKSPAQFIYHTLQNCRSRAVADGKSPQSIGGMGGNWLEYALLVVLKEKKLTPAYWQAEFRDVPNAFNDVLVWSEEYGPVILSCKTSLRERYKQADLEAVALQRFYSKAKYFLVTLDDDKSHVARVRKKIKNGEILALQAVYDETNLDELFAFLGKLTLTEADASALHRSKVVR